MKRGIPFSIELSSGIKTRDAMTDEDFDEMMQAGLLQAKEGEAVPYGTAFEQLMQGL